MLLSSLFGVVLSSAVVAATTAGSYVNQTTCNTNTYTYEELAGYGFIPSDARDKFGDTIGGIGSSIFIEQSQWKKTKSGAYTGILWACPDRGWNTEGTTNFQPRVHKFAVTFTPNPSATVASPSGNNLVFKYLDTILFYGPDGEPTTGLDADGTGHLSFKGFPDLPVATFTGDGFGGGDMNEVSKAIPIDAEGIIVNKDGTFWVSDEYGPYVYHFDRKGKMVAAIRPNDAIIPMRNGTESFSADSPPNYVNGGAGDDVIPADNPTGRDNNHGFEGLTITPDGKTLYVLLQAAANQEGGLAKQTERYVRLVEFSLCKDGKSPPKYEAEYVVPLPLYNDPTAKPSKNPKTAAQSEIHYVGDGQFFVLARDSGAGNGQTVTTSVYRQIDVFDIKSATNIKGNTYDCATCAIATLDGVLSAAITPATYCPFLDFNVNAQLNRFGVHNGGVEDKNLLNEKWESIAVVPVDGKKGDDGEWYIFSMSDNDFITQNGFLDFGEKTYKDASGFSLDNQALVFKVKLPKGTKFY